MLSNAGGDSSLNANYEEIFLDVANFDVVQEQAYKLFRRGSYQHENLISTLSKCFKTDQINSF